jgi:hypothetical protein
MFLRPYSVVLWREKHRSREGIVMGRRARHSFLVGKEHATFFEALLVMLTHCDL